MSMYLCIVQLYVHVLCNLMSMHCATWCPCIVQLYVLALCNLMWMHCATLSIYGKLGQTKSTKSCCPYIMQPDSQSYVHVCMYCATWCPCIVQLDVHALYKVMIVLCNLMSMHCATWCPCIVQLDVHALYKVMHCATWCPCIVQLYQYMEN